MKKLKSLVVFAREKHDGSNYYHVVNVYANGRFLGTGKDMGSGDANHFQTALEVLQSAGYFTKHKGKHLSSGARADTCEFYDWRFDNRDSVIYESAEITRWRDMPETTI